MQPVQRTEKIDNSIYIVGGREQPIIEDIIAEYKELNSAIEHSLIPKTKFLPQLESPAEFAAIVKMFLLSIIDNNHGW